jgi:glycine/D-amino acid oxidase-like deaminating enzyme
MKYRFLATGSLEIYEKALSVALPVITAEVAKIEIDDAPDFATDLKEFSIDFEGDELVVIAGAVTVRGPEPELEVEDDAEPSAFIAAYEARSMARVDTLKKFRFEYGCAGWLDNAPDAGSFAWVG